MVVYRERLCVKVVSRGCVTVLTACGDWLCDVVLCREWLCAEDGCVPRMVVCQEGSVLCVGIGCESR